jgi:TPP-dependent pyruvate/acetoin dehydrogenase alpha subunit
MIFICENNGYAIHTHQSLRQKNTTVWERAMTYGMPAERIEDNDVLRIYERVGEAVRALRAGQTGPFFFECMTYRWKEHVGPGEDYHLGYRSKAEAAPWLENDQVPRIGAMVSPDRRRQIEQEVEAEIAEAISFAERSPFPAAYELYTDVYKEA